VVCCAALQGVGDGKSNDFSGFQYSPHVANVIKPANLRPANDTWHPQIDDVVYWGMDWVRTTVAFLEPFLCVLKTIFFQDRLGTDIGQVVEKRASVAGLPERQPDARAPAAGASETVLR
jgi:hypothetical protein